MTDWFERVNQTDNNTLFLWRDGTCCPDWLTTLAPTFILLGAFMLLVYMAETRKDIGYAALAALTSIMAFNDTVLMSISYPTTGTYIPTLPFIMVLIGGYEIMMQLLLMREMNNRKNNGDDGE
jgi:hypothetical protein